MMFRLPSWTSRNLASRGLCRGPKAGGLEFVKARQDKKQNILSADFPGHTHKRWSDPMQAHNKDRTAESDPWHTGIWGRSWDPRHGKVRQPPCRGTRRRNQGCGLVWLGCPVNSNRVIMGGYVVRPDSVIVPFKLPSKCILYP